MKAKISASTKWGAKPEFNCTSQLYIKLTKSTANISQVSEAVHKQWGTDYTVVLTEGLEIDDSLATQGQGTYDMYKSQWLILAILHMQASVSGKAQSSK